MINPIPLSFGYSRGYSDPWNSHQLTNMFLDVDTQAGSTAAYVVRGTPGSKLWLDSGLQAEVRALVKTPLFWLAVVGNTLVEIQRGTKVTTTIGTIETSSGVIKWDQCPTQVMFVDGIHGYIYDKTSRTLTTISDDDLPAPSTVSFIASRFVVTIAGTGLFYISALNNGLVWDALDYATAEARADNLVTSIADHDELLMMGTDTIEWWRATTSPFPFAKVQGSTQEIGIGAKDSVARGDNVLFFLDSNGMARTIQGYNSIVISQDIQHQISKWPQLSDVIGFTTTERGRAFYVITSPSAGQTFVYDAMTKKWHRRASFPSNGKWRGNCAVTESLLTVVGDYENGRLYELDYDYYYDNGEAVKWIADTFEVKSGDDHSLIHHRLELRIEQGVGLITGQGEEPLVWMVYSNDSGKTWSNDIFKSMGKEGAYQERLRWQPLGRALYRRYRFFGSDPVKRVLISSTLEATACRN